MSVNSTMTALADEVRELSGKTGKLTLENMTDEVASGNETISDQASLIAQISAALEGKASGGTAPIIEPLSVTENGTYTAPDGVHGYSPVTVNVASSGGGETQVYGFLDNTITSIDSDVEKVVAYACRGLSKIKTVNVPNAKSIGSYAFYYCTAMTGINAPNVTSLDTYAFYNSAIKSVNFPLATSVPSQCFYSCSSLAKADFGAAKSIATSAFAYAGLDTLILRREDAICSLANKNALVDTPIENGTGYVYVPAALLDTYKAASNWSAFSNQFRAIEDYPEITGG